ncbi:MAG: hypothetical protein WKG07_10270 [Hymenobacter sp.]
MQRATERLHLARAEGPAHPGRAARNQPALRRRRAAALRACDFLADLPMPEARAWLESITAWGPKPAPPRCCSARLRLPAMPVDSHHHRVAQRLALIGPKVGEGPAHALLASSAAARLGRPAGVRPPRGAHVSRAKMLLFSPASPALAA